MAAIGPAVGGSVDQSVTMLGYWSCSDARELCWF